MYYIPKMGRSFNLIRKINHSNSSSNYSNPVSSSCDSAIISDKYKEVLQLVRRKGPPLTAKQMEYCSEACIGRFLKAKRENVKKAAKQLRETLAWRASLDVDFLTADEFSAELASGVAYVAGQDDVGRPVVIVRLKPEHLLSNSYDPQKQFLRYFVFTMEVAITCMTSGAEQCVLIFDASACVRKGSHVGISTIIQLLKVLGEHYPERLAKSFILDAPSMFYYLWKGIGKFLDIKTREKPRFVFSRNYTSVNAQHHASPSLRRTIQNIKTSVRTHSNRMLWAPSELELQMNDDDEYYEGEDKFEFDSQNTLVHNFPTTLSSLMSIERTSTSTSTTPTATPELSPTLSTSGHAASLISDKGCHARSFSFASSSITSIRKEESTKFRSFRADMQSSRQSNIHEDNGIGIGIGTSRRWIDLIGFGPRKDYNDMPYNDQNHIQVESHKDKSIPLFRPYYTSFLGSPYDEDAYRGRMKPPLAGLISIISQELRCKRPNFSFHNGAKLESMLYHLHFD